MVCKMLSFYDQGLQFLIVGDKTYNAMQYT